MGLGRGLIMGGMLMKPWVGEPNQTPRELLPNLDDLYGIGVETNRWLVASEVMSGRAK